MDLLINFETEEIDFEHIFSVKLMIFDTNTHKRDEFIKKFCVKTNTIIFEYEKNFKSSHDYIVEYSVMQYGKQLEKKRFIFTFINNDEYKFENLMLIKKSKKSIKNELNIIHKINDIITDNFYIDLNPIAIMRDQNNELEVYINGNILYLKNEIYSIIKYSFYNNNLLYIFNELNISQNGFIELINLLISKGVVVVYEK